MSFRRSVLMPCIAVVLTPLISGCFNLGWGARGSSGAVNVSPYGANVNVGFRGGGVNVNAGPFGAGVNVGFPGGGVNVGAGPGGAGVSVAAPGFNMNLGVPGRMFFYEEPPRSYAAVFPQKQLPVPQELPPVTTVATVPAPPKGFAPPLAGAMGAPAPQPLANPAALPVSEVPVPVGGSGAATPAGGPPSAADGFDDLRSR